MWSHWSDPAWIKRTKETRKLEELILTFVSAAIKMTEKSPDIEPRSKHEVLDKQLDVFLLLLQSVARTLGPVGKDVVARLENMHTSTYHSSLEDKDHSSSTLDELEETVESLFGPKLVEMDDETVLEVGC
jgi:hypothetical protein